jgi:hypothetical protein
MRFNISNEEVKTILEMHSKVRKNTFLIKEDAASDEERLRIAMTSGCLKGGSLKRSKSTGNIFYRKPSAQEPGKEVDFFADMTFKFTDNSKSGKWKCDAIGASLANKEKTAADAASQEQKNAENKTLGDAVLKEKKDKEGWMEYSELIGKGYSQLEADQGKYATEQFKLKTGETITLYKPKTGAVMGGQQQGMSAEQQAFITKFEAKGGKLKLTPEENASQRFRQISVPGSMAKDQGPFGDAGLKMYFDANTIPSILGDSNELAATVESQKITLDECKKFVDQFFEGYQDETDISDFELVKRKVQRCKVLYSPNPRTGRKNGWGMFSDQKNKIDILSGLVTQQGPSPYGEDSKWRLK